MFTPPPPRTAPAKAKATKKRKRAVKAAVPAKAAPTTKVKKVSKRQDDYNKRKASGEIQAAHLLDGAIREIKVFPKVVIDMVLSYSLSTMSLCAMLEYEAREEKAENSIRHCERKRRMNRGLFPPPLGGVARWSSYTLWCGRSLMPHRYVPFLYLYAIKSLIDKGDRLSNRVNPDIVLRACHEIDFNSNWYRIRAGSGYQNWQKVGEPIESKPERERKMKERSRAAKAQKRAKLQATMAPDTPDDDIDTTVVPDDVTVDADGSEVDDDDGQQREEAEEETAEEDEDDDDDSESPEVEEEEEGGEKELETVKTPAEKEADLEAAQVPPATHAVLRLTHCLLASVLDGVVIKTDRKSDTFCNGEKEISFVHSLMQLVWTHKNRQWIWQKLLKLLPTLQKEFRGMRPDTVVLWTPAKMERELLVGLPWLLSKAAGADDTDFLKLWFDTYAKHAAEVGQSEAELARITNGVYQCLRVSIRYGQDIALWMIQSAPLIDVKQFEEHDIWEGLVDASDKKVLVQKSWGHTVIQTILRRFPENRQDVKKGIQKFIDHLCRVGDVPFLRYLRSEFQCVPSVGRLARYRYSSGASKTKELQTWREAYQFTKQDVLKHFQTHDTAEEWPASLVRELRVGYKMTRTDLQPYFGDRLKEWALLFDASPPPPPQSSSADAATVLSRPKTPTSTSKAVKANSSASSAKAAAKIIAPTQAKAATRTKTADPVKTAAPVPAKTQATLANSVAATPAPKNKEKVAPSKTSSSTIPLVGKNQGKIVSSKTTPSVRTNKQK